MAEAREITRGDMPDWIQEAEKTRHREENMSGVSERKEVTIKFGRGLIGDPFTSKNGHELVEVKIPNADRSDHTPWASFVISPKMIHDNKFGKGVWMKLPDDGTTKVSKPVMLGEKEDGKKEWGNDVREVPNPELKEMMESYKTKDRTSLLGNLDEKKQEAAKLPDHTMAEKKAIGMEK